MRYLRVYNWFSHDVLAKILQFITKLDKAGKEAEKNEPGTLKYAPFVPVDESDETTLYVIEE
jgi:quinol monooxygenase YgiN